MSHYIVLPPSPAPSHRSPLARRFSQPRSDGGRSGQPDTFVLGVATPTLDGSTEPKRTRRVRWASLPKEIPLWRRVVYYVRANHL